jgi:hypothetical protein
VWTGRCLGGPGRVLGLQQRIEHRGRRLGPLYLDWQHDHILSNQRAPPIRVEQHIANPRGRIERPRRQPELQTQFNLLPLPRGCVAWSSRSVLIYSLRGEIRHYSAIRSETQLSESLSKSAKSLSKPRGGARLQNLHPRFDSGRRHDGRFVSAARVLAYPRVSRNADPYHLSFVKTGAGLLPVFATSQK